MKIKNKIINTKINFEILDTNIKNIKYKVFHKN